MKENVEEKKTLSLPPSWMKFQCVPHLFREPWLKPKERKRISFNPFPKSGLCADGWYFFRSAGGKCCFTLSYRERTMRSTRQSERRMFLPRFSTAGSLTWRKQFFSPLYALLTHCDDDAQNGVRERVSEIEHQASTVYELQRMQLNVQNTIPWGRRTNFTALFSYISFGWILNSAWRTFPNLSTTYCIKHGLWTCLS